jgi:phenylalanyl-tRNA synthetase alpha chain
VSTTLDRITELRAAAEQAIDGAPDTAALERARVEFLGRKAELPNLLRTVAQLAPEERSQVGRAANEARKGLEARAAEREEALAAGELEQRLVADRVDLTLPGRRPSRSAATTCSPRPGGRSRTSSSASVRRRRGARGRLGLLQLRRAQPHADAPRARAHGHVLRHRRHRPAHAHEPDAGPVDGARAAAAVRRRPRPHVPPRLDATHTPQFHQVEGLAVDEDITLADLKGTLLAFARAMFGDAREIRLRPHFFPFTEPSVEVDISCFIDHAALSGRCPVCRGTGWLEILGSGMVDPNVFGYVREHGYDPERISGFAFGMGIERIAMLKHAVPDLRLMFDNDLRFLEQFG